MPNGIVNSQSRLRSIRIPLELDDKVLAYAEQQGGLPHSKAFTQLVAKGLGCNTPGITLSSTPQAVGDLLARIEALEARLVPTQPQPQATTNGTGKKRLKRGVLNPATQWLDDELCPEGHVYQDTGKTRRDKSGRCLECARLSLRASRAKRKGI